MGTAGEGVSYPRVQVLPRRSRCYTAGVQTLRRIFRQAGWLAIVAMLGLALAPTVSHALKASGPGNPWAELCSVSGGKPGAADRSGPATETGTHLGHCPLCGQAGQAPALPCTEPAWAGMVDAGEVLSAGDGPSLQPAHVWPAAQARAPPASL